MVLSQNHDWDLIVTGLSMGLLHVLAGPDHLSALAALAVGTSYKAFVLGFRWGIGHSTGLVVVAIIFISLKGDLDLRTLGRYCDLLVGLFMIGLGSYGVVSAIRVYREKNKKRDADLRHQSIPLMGIRSSSTGNLSSLESGSDTGSVGSNGSAGSVSSTSSNKSSPDTIKERKKTTFMEAIFSHHDHHVHVHQNHDGTYEIEEEEHVVVEDCPWCPFIDMHDPNTQKIISFAIGLLHGVAGPGGILGVLPAVEMQRWQSSVFYLGSFIFASTLSMGTFAAMYGEVTKRIGATAQSAELALSIFSAAMSIIVGTIWFVLSLLGKLEDFFH